MTAIISLWPRRFRNQAVEITHTEYSDTHRFEYTADDILLISLDEELLKELEHVPEFIQRTRHLQGVIPLNKHNIKVLKRMLNELDID